MVMKGEPNPAWVCIAFRSSRLSLCRTLFFFFTPAFHICMLGPHSSEKGPLCGNSVEGRNSSGRGGSACLEPLLLESDWRRGQSWALAAQEEGLEEDDL